MEVVTLFGCITSYDNTKHPPCTKVMEFPSNLDVVDLCGDYILCLNELVVCIMFAGEKIGWVSDETDIQLHKKIDGSHVTVYLRMHLFYLFMYMTLLLVELNFYFNSFQLILEYLHACYHVFGL